MTNNTQSKSELKPTNIPWLGNIPADWEVRRLGDVNTYCNRGQTPDYSENSDDLIVINQSCVTYEGINFNKVKYDKSSNYDTSKGKLEFGDLLINSTGTGTLGRVCIFDSQLKAICDSHVTIFRPNKNLLKSEYLNYFFKHRQDLAVELLSEGATNQIELRSDWLRIFKIPLPPLPTQQAIVEYLDTKTNLISQFIADKQTMITRLKEQKQSLIHNAVTKGIQKSGELKPTNIPWLGDIPADWEVRRLKQCFYGISNGSTSTQVGEQTNYPVSRIETISKGEINFDKIGYVNNIDESFRIKKNDFLLSHINSFEYIGNTAIFNDSRTLYHGMNLLKIIPNLVIIAPMFAFYFLKSSYFKFAIQRVCKPAINQVSVSLSDLKDIQIPLPPLTTQQAIVEYLDIETAKIDTLIDTITQEIELTREYKQSLIYKAVTGKISVE